MLLSNARHITQKPCEVEAELWVFEIARVEQRFPERRQAGIRKFLEGQPEYTSGRPINETIGVRLRYSRE